MGLIRVAANAISAGFGSVTTSLDSTIWKEYFESGDMSQGILMKRGEKIVAGRGKNKYADNNLISSGSGIYPARNLGIPSSDLVFRCQHVPKKHRPADHCHHGCCNVGALPVCNVSGMELFRFLLFPVSGLSDTVEQADSRKEITFICPVWSCSKLGIPY